MNLASECFHSGVIWIYRLRGGLEELVYCFSNLTVFCGCAGNCIIEFPSDADQELTFETLSLQVNQFASIKISGTISIFDILSVTMHFYLTRFHPPEAILLLSAHFPPV